MADPQVIQQTQTTIPDYARPYVERMLGQAEAYTLNNLNPQLYPYARFASPDVLSQQAYNTIQNMGLGAEAGNSLQNMYNMAAQAGQSQYNPIAYGNQYAAPGAYQPGQFSYQSVSPQSAQYYQMQGPQDVSGSVADAIQLGNAPTATSQAMQAAQMGASPTATSQAMQAAQMGAAPTATAAQGVASLLGQAPKMRASAAERTQLGDAATMNAAQLGASP